MYHNSIVMKNMSYKLPVIFFYQGKHVVAYSPALDLSVQGRNEKEVIRRFSEAVEIFLEELDKNGTSDQVLIELGWLKSSNKKQKWIPPSSIANSPREVEITLSHLH